uniref:Pentapeptide MXKDX repeat protein n=1 Tax=Candidatus Kentrum sp. LFY TaxID=2126342 RepID=A0A450WKZ1_9GAMM|nr:MAG: hypothetical protein BECKLFY1418C_GA0070996_10345 [Candidatus Kentron sp. LFY]
MKYSPVKATALAVIIGAPIATFAAERAPLTEDAGFSAFQGIETMQVSGNELRISGKGTEEGKEKDKMKDKDKDKGKDKDKDKGKDEGKDKGEDKKGKDKGKESKH